MNLPKNEKRNDPYETSRDIWHCLGKSNQD